MKLYELAYACRLYRGQFDRAYDQMTKVLGRNPDLASQAQQDSLMRFLNDWRCRIPQKNFPILKERLQRWATLWVPQLPDTGRDIRSLNESERARIGTSYEALLNLGAGLNFQDTAGRKDLACTSLAYSWTNTTGSRSQTATRSPAAVTLNNGSGG